MSMTVLLPPRVAERVRREAERLGLTPEELVVETLVEGLDPEGRAYDYLDAARLLLEQAREELEKGDARQAAEKLWGAAALAVKAYAYWREGKRLTSHGELWEYIRTLAGELGRWVSDAWYAANSMHTCFYEGWCTGWHVEQALERVERLVREVETRLKTRHG